MADYRIETFTKWKQSDGTHYPYNIRTIKADSEDAALEIYRKRFDPQNKVGIFER